MTVNLLVVAINLSFRGLGCSNVKASEFSHKDSLNFSPTVTVRTRRPSKGVVDCCIPRILSEGEKNRVFQRKNRWYIYKI